MAEQTAVIAEDEVLAKENEGNTRRIYPNMFSEKETPSSDQREKFTKAESLDFSSDAERLQKMREAQSFLVGKFNIAPELHEDGVSPSLPDMGGMNMPPALDKRQR